MRLLFVIDTLGSGGAQRQLVELAIALRRSGDADARALSYHGAGFFAERLADHGVPLRIVERRGRTDLGFPRRLAAAIAEEEPDLLHAFLATPGFWCAIALSLRRPGAPRPALVAAERSSLTGDTPLFLRMKRFLYRRADAVTVNSRSAAYELERRLGIAPEKLHILPNGIDLDAWDALRREPCPIPLPEAGFRVGLIGGLRPEKNHALLLRALQALGSEATSGWSVLFMGDATAGPQASEDVRRAVRAAGLGDVVRIEPAVRNLAAVLERLDVVVLISRFEGFPNVVLEAMATSRPVVATPVGAVPELVQDGITGRIVPPDDAQALAAALAEIAELSPTERREMGARGRRHVERHYELATVASSYAQFYRSLRPDLAPEASDPGCAWTGRAR